MESTAGFYVLSQCIFMCLNVSFDVLFRDVYLAMIV